MRNNNLRLDSRLRLLITTLATLTVSLSVAWAFGDDVLKAEISSNDKVDQRATSVKSDEKPGMGVVVTDKVENHVPSVGYRFIWKAGGRTIEGWVPPARKEKDAVVTGKYTQQWNTFSAKSLAESPRGELELLPVPRNRDGETTITASRWVMTGAGTKAEAGNRLFGRLLDGDEKGKERFSFSSEARKNAKDEYEVMFTITNSMKQTIKYEWAGFEGSLKPGETVTKKRKTRGRPEERSATASVTLAEGEKRLITITAHYWYRE